MKYRWLFLPVILWMCAAGDLFAQTTIVRLLGKSTYARDSFAYSLADSIRYNYSGNRGSDIEKDIHLYDSSQRTVIVNAVKEPNKKWIRRYDTANRIIQQTAIDFVNGAWRNNTDIFYKYASGTLYDTVLTRTWDTTALVWKDKRMQHYKYNSGSLDTIHWYMPYAGGWTTEGFDTYVYSSAGLSKHELIIYNDSLIRWDIWGRELYNYDGVGDMDTFTSYVMNPTTLQLKPSTKEAIQYYPSHEIASHYYHIWHSVTNRWEGTFWHYFYYNTNNTIDEEVTNYWDIAAQQWGPLNKRYYYYDVSDNLIELIEKKFRYPLYDYFFRENWIYNSQNLPMQYRRFTWYSPTAFWMPEISKQSQVLYYYENVTGVQQAANQKNEITVFPNPAKGQVFVKVEGRHRQSCSIALYDVYGRLVAARQYDAALASPYQLPLTGVAAGHYILRFANGDEEMTKTLIVAD